MRLETREKINFLVLQEWKKDRGTVANFGRHFGGLGMNDYLPSPLGDIFEDIFLKIYS